ncbi:MAG: IS630 family transposase [Deltaproteobacteria bacterium]|nr:IS630 family transposase [Deltaproteobacteria bacterium]
MSWRLRQELERLLRRGKAEHRQVVRACIVLKAADGEASRAIAKALGVDIKTVREWRRRFSRERRRSMHSLMDAARSGRPPRVPLEVRCEVVKLACDRPHEHVPFRNIWNRTSLSEALWQETGWRLSASEVGRILRDAELRPHRMRLWLHSPDPRFRELVRIICALYLRPPAGATVLCVDEKTCIQALERRRLFQAAVPGRVGRSEFEYIRHGTRNLIAALDIATGKVFGQCRKRRTAKDLAAFMEQLARRYPTGEVYIVWDNLNIHCGDPWKHFSARHGGRFHFVHTPKHASWMNQIEIWFSILHRRVLKHGDFANVDQMLGAILGFIAHWNRVEAHPFRWTFRGRFTHHRRAA